MSIIDNTATSNKATPSDGGVPSPTVLVVDDEYVNTVLLDGILRGAGFDTLVAASGSEARSLAQTRNPDLILLDVMMPEEDGFETCRLLKQDARTADIPIIFISAMSDVKSKVAGLELGAVDYIAKPFENAEVVARIRLHLKLQFAVRALVEAQAAKLAQITAAQQAILATPEDVPGASFAVRYVPALEAGGDFYDVFPAGAGMHMYFVADVCGHDLGASFVTSSLKALLRQNSGPLFTPLETMKHMNLVLKSILQNGRFLSAQTLVVNRETATFELISAGHPSPVLVKASGETHILHTEGDVLGVFENAWLDVLGQCFEPGDRIYLYTDGLVERYAEGAKANLLERERELLDALREKRGLPLEQAVSEVVDSMFRQFGPPQDDVVLLGVEL
ncbi:histidine kinase [Oceanidesulfovibrio indonesiensis]|uniref:Histidine kinase n=1 Tax=Oceanidesulfovibrio indonesiensis TaxID=54767 RepID=A0A7M3MDV2_9BACT|nr:SpoIIE family protein phosphatase [Oceanidesulfovibrio indonesiensis]TVM16882.1 histidine kinase [Oceanidesulfovibrio indonesiensis]